MPGTVCLTFDLDAVALWVDTFRSKSPSAISRGEFGPDVGLPRILDMLDRRSIAATFFVPGMVAELYPNSIRSILDHGHEVGSHGDTHKLLPGMPYEDEYKTLKQGVERLAEISGQLPVGFRAPAWELSFHTIGILSELGFHYDSSQFGTDFRPYRARAGDSVHEGVWAPGQPTDIWEFPIAWELDDVPYFLVHPPAFTGGAEPEAVGRIWQAELDFMVADEPSGVFTLTMHPQVIGRGPRVLMLERFIVHAQSLSCDFATLAEVTRRLEQPLTPPPVRKRPVIPPWTC